MEIVHLFASDGRWIAWYRPGLPYVWSVRNQWIGWFAWPADSEVGTDLLDPSENYLGTVVGDRLLRRTFRMPRPVVARVPEPRRPVGPPDRDRAAATSPPPGYVDVPAAALGH